MSYFGLGREGRYVADEETGELIDQRNTVRVGLDILSHRGVNDVDRERLHRLWDPTWSNIKAAGTSFKDLSRLLCLPSNVASTAIKDLEVLITVRLAVAAVSVCVIQTPFFEKKEGKYMPLQEDVSRSLWLSVATGVAACIYGLAVRRVFVQFHETVEDKLPIITSLKIAYLVALSVDAISMFTLLASVKIIIVSEEGLSDGTLKNWAWFLLIVALIIACAIVWISAIDTLNTRLPRQVGNGSDKGSEDGGGSGIGSGSGSGGHLHDD